MRKTRFLCFLAAGFILLCLLIYVFFSLFSFRYPKILDICHEFRDSFSNRLHEHSYLSADGYRKELGAPDGHVQSFSKVYDLSDPNIVKTITADGTTVYIRQVHIPEQGITLLDHGGLYDLTHTDFSVDQVIIREKWMRFGWLHIGIGTPKWIIQLAYFSDVEVSRSNVKKMLSTIHTVLSEDRPEDFTLGYRSGFDSSGNEGVEIAFRFDENNRVDMMVLNFASGMP